MSAEFTYVNISYLTVDGCMYDHKILLLDI